MNSGRGLRPHVSTPRFVLPPRSEAIALSPKPDGLSALSEGRSALGRHWQKLWGRGLAMIHLYSSLCCHQPCCSAWGQPPWLFHIITTLVSLKMFAQKKPRVWLQLVLGFQGNFPSSSDSMGDIARMFALYLAG